MNRHQALSRAAGLTVFAMGCTSVLCTSVLAQYQAPDPIYNAPGTYYNAATGTGATLKTNLNTIIKTGFDSVSYEELKTTIPITDRDPANTSNVLLVYSGYSVQGLWSTGGTIWNREHVWCDSYGILGGGIDYSDQFNIRPCNPNVNSDRNNEYYDDVPLNKRMSGHALAPLCYENTDFPDVSQDQMWEPLSGEKGDLARGLFYMDTRYDGTDSNTMDLTLTDNVALIQTDSPYMGKLSTLLKWHYQDGITNEERRRNDVIYDSGQKNRNPFIDHPEYVWTISGGGVNNSKITVGASPNADGSSATTANLRVMKNGAWGTTNVAISKTGVHPTTYDLTAGGFASTVDAGTGQTFDYNAQGRNITVGLTASTSTTGLKTGTVTLDNTDLTTGGTGLGSADGNDTITVNGQVVDNRVIAASTAAFGRVVIGSAVTTGTMLSSAGSDDSNTRVTVKAAASAADANGAFITAGVDNLFNGTLTSADRTVQANFATTGAKAGSRSFTMQGEGLAGEVVNGVSVSYSATAVDHAQPSLVSGSSLSSQTVDFGYVPTGFTARTANFTIYNNASASGAALTASMDVDGTSISGSSAMTDNVAASPGGSPLAANAAGWAYVATFTPGIANNDDTSTHTISISDENIPGGNARPSLSFISQGRSVAANASFPATGFIDLFNGETFMAGTFSIGSGVALTKNGLGGIIVNGAQSNGSNSSLAVQQGSVTFNTNAGSASNAPLAISAFGAASVTFNSTQHLSSLSASGGQFTITTGGDKTIVTNVLSAAGGKIDLTDNKLITNSVVGTQTDGIYDGVQGLIQAGYGSGIFDGTTGITTSQTDATNGSGLTTIGVSTGALARFLGPTDTDVWAGQIIDGNSTMVMYTYIGDANLDGFLDGTDYFYIDNGISTPGADGFANGDFNYDGVIDSTDYFYIDNNIALGLPVIYTSGGSELLVGVASVPEPSTFALAALGALMLRRRHR